MKSLDQIIVEKLRRTDIEQVLKIAEECKLAVWSKSDYLIEIERKESFLAAAKDKDEKNKDEKNKFIVGFIVVRFNESDSNKRLNNAEADVLNIGVLTDYQKKGIGNLLLNTFLQTARRLKIQNVWLEVRKSNYNARSFYRRSGFVEIQERKNFYSQPTEDAVVMKLAIKNI